MSNLSRFFKHSSIYAVGNIVNRLGAFILLPVYTNYLTVGEYGRLELFYVVMSIASGFLAIGMAHATLRFYFEYKDQKDRHTSVSTNLIGSFVVTTAGIIVLAFFSENISTFVFEDASLKIGLYLIFATLVFELSSQICLAYVRAIEYSMFFVIISVLKLTVQVSVNTYLVIFQDAGIIGVLFGNLCTVILGWLILTIFTIRRCGFNFEWEKFIPILRYCLPFLPATAMALIYGNASQYYLNYLVSVEALGLFALALKFSLIIEQLIGEPFSRSYGAFRYTIMDNDDASELQAKIVKYLLVITAFFALCLTFFAEDVIRVMSEESFWPASKIIPIIMISSVLKILTYPAQTGILYAKKTIYFFYFSTVAAIVSVAGNYFLIGLIGLYGACLSLVLTDLVVLFLTSTVSQRYFRVDYEYKKLATIVILAVGTYLLSRLYIPEWLFVSVLQKFFLLGIFSWAVINLKVINSTEIRQVKLYLSEKLSKPKTA